MGYFEGIKAKTKHEFAFSHRSDADCTDCFSGSGAQRPNRACANELIVALENTSRINQLAAPDVHGYGHISFFQNGAVTHTREG